MSMDAPARCKRCLLKEAMPADYEKYVAGMLDKIPASRRAPDGDYQSRLKICGACDQLSMGTCMGCGCLVELRAAYKNEKCPFRHW